MVILLLVGIAMQVAVFPNFRLFGAQPNVVLVIAILVGVIDGPVEGAVIGFAGGLMSDMVGSQVVGAGAFSLAVTAFSAGVLKNFFVTYSILLPMFLTFVLGLFEQAVYYSVLVVLGQDLLPVLRMRYMLPASGYDVLLVLVLYPLMGRLRFPDRTDSQLLMGGS